MNHQQANQRNLASEISIIKKFIEVYCRKQHSSKDALCSECVTLQDYALKRLGKCPYHPKPPCKQCPTHCYTPDKRLKIKEVMRYAGIYYVKRGRLDWLIKYFLINKTLNKQELEAVRQQSKTVKFDDWIHWSSVHYSITKRLMQNISLLLWIIFVLHWRLLIHEPITRPC